MEDIHRRVIKIQTIGYHGTTKENAEKILSEQRFYDSRKNNEWLGTGVYFFTYRKHAEWWVSTPRYNDKETRLLQAHLEYIPEQLVDLDDPTQLASLENMAKRVATRINASDKNIIADCRTVGNAKRWCWACNLLKKLCPKIGIIIYTFPQPYINYVSGFYSNQRQICVSNHSIIKSVESV